ncbi:MAG: phosphoglycerate kinase [Candidatus Wildermuthbacteria bacterium]|nr:phosphoglycerate kinase [Candidatus Wildermuthbacteria bacterium]
MMKSLRDFQLEGKRVLVRCDFNVPLDEQGNIVDDFRIQESMQTIQYARERGAKVILLAHLGRPTTIFQIGETSNSKSQIPSRSQIQKEESLKPIAQRLQQLLNQKITFIEDPIGEKAEKQIEMMKPGDVVLLENIRFYKGEEENDPAFAKLLASLGEVYINEAFSVNHRAHASLVGIPKFLPSAAGLLLEKEVEALGKVVKDPTRPVVVIIGGTKIESKTHFLEEMCQLADEVLVGNPVFNEIQSKNLAPKGREKIVGPADGIPSQEQALDIGPETVKLYAAKIAKAKTVFWTGPLGKAEEEEYAKGSLAVAKAIIASGAFSVVGGGDLVGFLDTHGLRDKFSHVSTGGSAMLAFLSGEELPGLKALEI